MTSLAVIVAATAALAITGAECARAGGPAYDSVEEARKAGPAYDLQGEYEGTAGGKKVGVQVIALGGGRFQAVFLPGGLPGAGWDGETKILCQGALEEGTVSFETASGDRKYLGKEPGEFSATKRFPPAGQKPLTAALDEGKLSGKTHDGKPIEAKRVERKSPTLEAKPPAGAMVLLPYEPGEPTSLDEWTNPNWAVKTDGSVTVTKGGNQTKKTFAGPWRMHLEFKTPFQPTARGQGRGNSGVFPPGDREIQVLDSFGLEGMPNECGGIYKSHRPKANMCLPPLEWQTYDVWYHPARTGPDGQTEPAWYKVVHNGVTIHEKVELGEGREGPLKLQDHGNPVSYRNIWFTPGKADE
jgi:hypothetical protein